MSRVSCPHCDKLLTNQQLGDGWCEGCGKKIPTHVLAAVHKATHHVHVPGGQEGTLPAATGRPTLAGYFIILVFVFIGALFTVALENGGIRWSWLGCAVGAVVGVGAAQAFGCWPSRRG